MARTAAGHLSEREEAGRAIQFDGLRVALFILHLAILAYVTLGWLIPSRVALYVYTLLLPLIAMQWLLNGGASIVNNIENLVRVGQWNDVRNHVRRGILQDPVAGHRRAGEPGADHNRAVFLDVDFLDLGDLPHDADRAFALGVGLSALEHPKPASYLENIGRLQGFRCF